MNRLVKVADNKGLLEMGFRIYFFRRMVAPHAVDTKQPTAVADAVKAAFGVIGAEASFPLLEQLFADVTDMFEGRHDGYQAIDMKYHDFEHSLQATVCLTHMLHGQRLSSDLPVMKVRDWELAVMSVLLHDTGFLKKTGDDTGTGAKYTFCHERRSCDFARGYLPSLGVTESEVEDVCSAIICTGPRSRIGEVVFRGDQTRQIAFMLVTADYLAQMSAADYLDKLPKLYQEFVEAFDHEGIPEEKRVYQNLRSLLEKSPGFWHNYVRPLLDAETGGVYRYLSPAGQPNPYLDAVEANLLELQRRLVSGEA